MAMRNLSSSSNIVYFIVFIIVCIAGYLLYINLEYHTVEKDRGFQGEALTNKYLAAEFYLLRMGQNTKKIKMFTDKQANLNFNDTLLIPSARLAFDSRRSKDVIDWVKKGGHLIITGRVAAENKASQRDHILDDLGLSIERKVLSEYSTQGDNPVSVSTIGEEFLWVDFDDYLVISKTAAFNSEIIWSIDDDDRTHGMQIKLGNGYLTLLSDMRLFKSDYIVKYDHAAFLFLLSGTQLAKGESGVLYYSLFENQLSLFQWLWENSRLLVMSFIMFLIVGLWMLVPRFGPLINETPPIRRQFLEHLKASGNYHWRQGNYIRLLTDVRKQLSQQVKKKYPEWSSLNRQDQIMHFSDISQLESAVIERALFDTDVQQENDFIKKIKILEKLRKSL